MIKQNYKEFIRFCMVGVIATITLYITYWTSLNAFNPTISYTIGYLFAFGINYILTTSFTFKVEKTAKNAMGFIVSNVINYLISIGLLNLFLHFGLNNKIAPLCTIFIATLSNFLIVRLVMKNF